ncbi:MAG: thioesterase [Blastomonas sp. CACIA14H2]|jgi:acyl-CoA thioester hydrolase|uniref:acyl-CoA thioesterase n=1 Tax=unclassified Blastomonas TaxID=2626550 RepID=UPI0003D044DF|nr:acyl-CoA thioesterase [Blastomonas sp. UPD001]ESZ87611.1 MAG: thioesterase [Blastomonas sp. CACIA14H2]
MTTFSLPFTAEPQHIDELGHVNNAVWVQWLQELSVAHWNAAADPAHVAAYFWVIVRHEIDYRGNIGLGETAIGRTWVPGTPKGARFARHAAFADASGRDIVTAISTWAMLDKATGRPARVTADIAAAFQP